MRAAALLEAKTRLCLNSPTFMMGSAARASHHTKEPSPRAPAPTSNHPGRLGRKVDPSRSAGKATNQTAEPSTSKRARLGSFHSAPRNFQTERAVVTKLIPPTIQNKALQPRS